MKQTTKSILFDIDRTLFNTDLFTRRTSELLYTLIGCTPEEFTAQKRKYGDTLESPVDFNPEEYINHLAHAFGVARAPLRKLFLETPALYADHIFKDSIAVLRTLSPRYQLGIYSEGHHAFQTLKITHTGVMDYVQTHLTFIEPRKATSAVKQKIPKDVIIIDDKIIIVEELARWEHITPIWINRYTQEKHATIRTIHNLTQLADHLT